ncbi:MAG: DASS family sodium-coupled anion symporter [Vicingaceae bacterium]
MITKKRIGLLLGPWVFILIQLFFRANDLSDEGVAVLASTAWIAIWWITEAIAIEVTALLPLILFPLLGVSSINETGSAYGHKFIFLFIGGFMLAIAVERWNLHKRIALMIIKMVGTSLNYIMLGFMLSTALLSMWISNTATTVMMLPIGMAVIKQLNGSIADSKINQFQKALMLAIAYSASIGGIATLVGTPPNLVFAGVVEKLYQIDISFLKWMSFGFPLSLILLAICWVYLSHFAYSLKGIRFPGGKKVIHAELKELGKMSTQEKRVAMIFCFTAIAWISRSFLLKDIIPGLDDSIIALVSAILLFIIPSGKKGRALLKWEEAVKLPWGVLLLFGGGIALAVGFEQSGLAEWIGAQLHTLKGVHLFVLVLVVVATINFLTEVTSNLATTTILLPVLAVLAEIIGIHPMLFLAGATTAASCAFMLPVATPPNALVFGSGYVKIGDMIKTGVWLNIISIVLLTLIVYFLLPLIWGFELTGTIEP